MKVDAVVLAGGDGAVIDPSCRFKGLLPISGRPMVEWVVEGLRSAETVAEVAVVVPTAENLGAWANTVDKLVVSDGSFADNVIAGVASFRTDRHVLVVTGDVPAIDGPAVDDFVRQSLDRAVDFSYPLIRKKDMLEQFPGSDRTFVRIADGPVTGGNMALLSPGLVVRNREVGQRLFDTRKSPIRMATVLGPTFIARLVTGRLHPTDVERKMEQLLGGKCAAIYTQHASIGADVDKPADVIVTERVLYARAKG